MIGCHIIFSEKLNRFYIGATQEDVEKRIESHIAQKYGKHRFTAKADDWQLFLFIECENYKQAIKIERHIKKMKSRVYVQNLNKYPEMIENLKNL